jgi:hypothetical protein
MALAFALGDTHGRYEEEILGTAIDSQFITYGEDLTDSIILMTTYMFTSIYIE